MWNWLDGILANPGAIAAVVAALLSTAAALFNVGLTQWNAGQLENLKAQLQDSNASRSARRDYEYEARKRLYEEIEPLLFQLHEAVEEAYYRVRSIARTSRDNDLEWFTREGYFLKSTIHRLLLPAVIFRIIQRRMTFVDLHVDETIRTKYHLLKMYAWTFTDDFDFKPQHLAYKPDDATDERLKTHPETYWRQGIYTGALEKAIDAMLTPEGKSLRPMTFGEFEAAVEREAPGRECLDPLVNLYFCFEPEKRPILARMLHAQGCIAALLLNTYRETPRPGLLSAELERFLKSTDFTQDFRWSKHGPAGDAELMESYISSKFNRIAGRDWKSA